MVALFKIQRASFLCIGKFSYSFLGLDQFATFYPLCFQVVRYSKVFDNVNFFTDIIFWCIFLLFSITTPCTRVDKFTFMEFLPAQLFLLSPHLHLIFISSPASLLFISMSHFHICWPCCKMSLGFISGRPGGLRAVPSDRNRDQSLTELKEVAGLVTNPWAHLLLNIVTCVLEPSCWISTV